MSGANPNGIENSRGSRWAWIIGIACALVVLIAVVAPHRSFTPAPTPRSQPSDSTASTAPSQIPGTRSTVQPLSAEQIVADKVNEFARDRLRIIRAMAKRLQAELPEEVDQFFNAVAAGKWDELNALYKKLETLRENGGNEKLRSLWGPILETLLIAECAHEWPAQKLLDYGQATLGSLAPGMIYVGGTDPGRGIPTLLNETSGGDRHIILTQNGLADGSYMDYLRFLYGDQLRLPNETDIRQAFNDYIADAQKRFEHDRLFPDEPKQVRPGEEIQALADTGNSTTPKIQVSGNVAVMAINERILRQIMDSNPGMSFALEESFPLQSTYDSAMPLGPLMELRAPDAQSSFTLDTASDTLDYWRNAAEQLAADADAPDGSAVRKTYSHMAWSQANLLASHNYDAEAEQTYRLAMEIEPSNPEAVYSLADLLGKAGRLDEARQLVDTFVQSHPGITPPPQSSFVFGPEPPN